MDKEFKITAALLFILLGVAALLLELLAGVHFFSREFFRGFLPFTFLLVPYIFFSSHFVIALYRDWLANSFWKKLLFPCYLLVIYTIFGILFSTFQWPLFLRLSLWLFLPTLLFSSLTGLQGGELNVRKFTNFGMRDFCVILILWLPVEFGKLPGFDIIFKEDIHIPGLAFAAPVLGLYLFEVLRNLPNIGFTFKWKIRDVLIAVGSLLLLAVILIPLGTQMGFIRFSILQTSLAQVAQLIIGIYFLVALPEELLFRGIIQNLLSKFFVGKNAPLLSLLAASLIFGFSHLNNFSPPDWRYVFLATLAGMFYGIAYRKTGKTTISAIVHCGVNFFWAILFKDTSG